MASDPADTATQKGALKLRQLSLVGTLTGPDGPQALLRLPNGSIARASEGDELAGIRITAITSGEVLLIARGKTYRLDIPGS